MTSETEGWIMCAWCAEEWPAEAFKASGSAARAAKVCSACWLERYPQRRADCSVCGRRMTTRGQNEFPTCRACRAANRAAAERARLQLTKAPRFCRDCGAGLGAPDKRGLRCRPCYNAAMRRKPSYERRIDRLRTWTETHREERKAYMRDLRARKRAA